MCRAVSSIQPKKGFILLPKHWKSNTCLLAPVQSHTGHFPYSKGSSPSTSGCSRLKTVIETTQQPEKVLQHGQHLNSYLAICSADRVPVLPPLCVLAFTDIVKCWELRTGFYLRMGFVRVINPLWSWLFSACTNVICTSDTYHSR